MAEQTYLRNAPIAEAVIDLRVRLPESFMVDQIRDVASDLKKDYPVMEEMRFFQTALQMQGAQPSVSTVPPKLFGFLFKSSDGKQIAQFRNDGFTFSRLKPYTR